MEAPVSPEPQEAAEGVNSYESLMTADFVPRELQEKWLRYEQAKRRLREGYERIESNQDLVERAKQEQAAELEAREVPRIEQQAKELRQGLLKSAASAERSSLPIPLGESLSPDDPTKILISQGEANRIRRRIERAQNRQGPFKLATEDILKD